MEKAEKLLGRKLNNVEKVLVLLMHSDENYELYLNSNGDIAYKRVNA